MVTALESGKARVLIADDEEQVRSLLRDVALAMGLEPVLARDGAEALALMREQDPDLILLDVLMPGMDGFAVLDRIQGDSDFRHVPVIVISAVDGEDVIISCIQKGAADYLTKPFNVTRLKARVNSCLAKKRLYDQEMHWLGRIADHNVSLEARVQRQAREIQEAQKLTIFALASLAESRDPQTGRHLHRIQDYCELLCADLRQRPEYADAIDDRFISAIRDASALHDIGKVGVPDRILLKPGRLSAEEFEIMKRHTTIGAETLKAVEVEHPGNRLVGMGIEIARSHHERWDGAGYPDGLGEDRIPLPARIVALADSYDALTSKRPYKAAFTHEKSREIILEESATHFDPIIVGAFVQAEDEFTQVRAVGAE
jgi:putative two-component system response regulator